MNIPRVREATEEPLPPAVAKSPKSIAFPVVSTVIYSITSLKLGRLTLPPAINPRVPPV
jgi:hypothetical protein